MRRTRETVWARTAGAVLVLTLATFAMPALAQFGGSPGYDFLKAVKDRDGTKATDDLSKPGNTVLLYREDGTGDMALHIVTKRRDFVWMQFLLAKGAAVDSKDYQGNTALMDAARIGYVEGEQLLASVGASPNLANDRGETPLIAAVQAHDIASVRVLLQYGADPKQQDHVAGLSAYDYAKRDARAAPMLKLMQDAKPVVTKQVSGPSLN